MTTNQPERDSTTRTPGSDEDPEVRIASDPDPDPDAVTAPDRAPGLGEPAEHPDPDPDQV